MWAGSIGTAPTYACSAVQQSILYTPNNKKCAWQYSTPQCSLNHDFTHTHQMKAVTHGLSSCSKRGRGTEVIHVTTLTIAKIYTRIMLLVDEI